MLRSEGWSEKTLRAQTPQSSSARKRKSKPSTSCWTRRDFREANQEFEAFYQAKRREVDQWFKGKKGRPQSIRDLAKAIGNDTEYGTLFKFGSGHTHGGYAMNHASFLGGGIAMEPIRTVEGYNPIFTTVVHITLGIYMKLIQRFRSGEVEQFRATYVQQWRDRIRNLPELEIESDYK